jgi:hypothetical protein
LEKPLATIRHPCADGFSWDASPHFHLQESLTTGPAQLAPGLEAKIDAAVQQDVASGRIAGAEVAVLRDHKLASAAPLMQKTVFA